MQSTEVDKSLVESSWLSSGPVEPASRGQGANTLQQDRHNRVGVPNGLANQSFQQTPCIVGTVRILCQRGRKKHQQHDHGRCGQGSLAESVWQRSELVTGCRLEVVASGNGLLQVAGQVPRLWGEGV